MKRRKKKSNIDNDDYEDFRPFPTYVILSCAITVILSGIYLVISHQTANGIQSPGKYGGSGGKSISLTGGGAIFIGIVLSLFPAFELINSKKKKKSAKIEKPIE